MDASRGTVTVVVRGELDAVAVPALAAELAKIAEHEPRHLVFDLTGLCFLDCAAARLIAGSGRFLTRLAACHPWRQAGGPQDPAGLRPGRALPDAGVTHARS